MTHLLRILSLLPFLCCAKIAQADSPTVFAAASLADVLRVATNDMAEQPRLSFAGSGAIARQVDQGAPADLVILANPVWMDWLEKRGHLLDGTRNAPFGNALVLVGPRGAAPLSDLNEKTITSRLGAAGRIAIGEHRSVPVGQYTKAWLDNLGLWASLQPRLAETENVRAALALVTRGEVPLAVVYASDLVAAPDAATVVWSIPDHQQPAIAYAMAALTPKGKNLAEALQTPESLQIFQRFGFKVAP